jgi:serine/threonine protein kinase/tetratricopeptide (TPR) repeat protein
MSASPETKTNPETMATDARPQVLINGRYRVVRELGQGGMGSVFLVADERDQGKPLALKRVRGDRLDKKGIAILRNEFLALTSVRHPGLATVYDFGVDRESSDYFFTCEFVDGVNLLKACRGLVPQGDAAIPVLVDLVAQVLRALEFIHSRGLVHGDIKPENILVTGLDAQGQADPVQGARVKLIDFGLTRKEKEFGGKKIIGTTYYIAPETINGSQVDRRTDLYSLGCVLYHVVTGKVPFPGDSNLAVLKAHIEKAPEDPSVVRPGVSQALGRVILDLMQKRPGDRPQTALAVISDLNAALGLSFPLETEATFPSYFDVAYSSDRAAHLGKLCEAFGAGCSVAILEAERELNLSSTGLLSLSEEKDGPSGFSRGRFVLLRGEKGLGKRRLIRDFKNIVQTQGAIFLAVECASGTSPRPDADSAPQPSVGDSSARCGNVSEEVPHQEFLRLLDGLSSLTFLEEAFRETLDKLRALTAEPREKGLTPEATSVLEEGAVALLDLSREQPIVLHFHDLHEGGHLLLGFFHAIVMAQIQDSVPLSKLLLVGSSTDRVDMGGSVLQGLFKSKRFKDAAFEVCLSRLNAEDVEDFVNSLCAGHDFTDAFMDRLVEETDGNPELLREILSFLVRKGVIQRKVNGWTLVGSHDAQAIPGKVRSDLRERLRRLDPAALNLAVAFAYLGNATPMDLALRLAGTPKEAALERMQVLCREKILDEDLSEGRLNVYSFVHSSAQTMLYGLVPPEKRPALHDRAGFLSREYYLAAGRENPKKLALHFLRARNKEEGVRHGLAAAKVYADEYQPRKAVETYLDVLSLLEDGSSQQRESIQCELARVCMELGEFSRALELLVPIADARLKSGQRPSPTPLLVDVAICYTRLGDFTKARNYLKEGIAVERQQVLPVWMFHLLLASAELSASLGGHEESISFCERILKSRDQIHDRKLLLQVYCRLVESHRALDCVEKAMLCCQEALKLSDAQVADKKFLDSFFFIMGSFYACRDKFSKALNQYQLSLSVRKKRGLVDAQGHALAEMGAMQICLERPREAARLLKQAHAIFERTGNAAGGTRVLNLLGEVHALLGEYEDSQKAVTESVKRAREMGHQRLVTGAYTVCASISMDRGDHEGAERYLGEVDREEKIGAQQALKVLEMRSQMALERGQFDRALEFANQGLDRARKSGKRLLALPFLQKRAMTFLRLGALTEANRAQERLQEVAHHFGLHASTGRAHFIHGVIQARTGDAQGASREFCKAAEIFKAAESERDLIHLYLEHGLCLLQAGQHEETFLCLEEATYLAKKHNLTYWKCRLHEAMGLLELQMPGGDLGKAKQSLSVAERYARNAPYLDILWQTQYSLGVLAVKLDAMAEAHQHLESASRVRETVLEGIAEVYRSTYLTVSPGQDMKPLMEECRRKAATLTTSL